MGREIRKVAKGWDHPLNDEGDYAPLHQYGEYDIEDGIPWNCTEYMPQWEDSEMTHIQMYETCSEGTPISPVFEVGKEEDMARWLADTGASAFGNMTASYEGWLATIREGYALCAVAEGGVLTSGVEWNLKRG